MTPQDILRLCTPPNVDPSCPARAPPPGQTALDPNAHTLLPITLSVTVICGILITTSMSIRVFTRYQVMRKLAAEDYLMSLATIGWFAFVGCVFSSPPFGNGKHMWNVTIAQFYKVLQRVYIGQLVYCIHLYPAKLAALLQIKHIFAPRMSKKTYMYYAIWATIALTTGLYIAVFSMCIFTCIPVRRVWEPSVAGWCMDKSIPGTSSSIVSLGTDVIILTLPIIGVARLQMPRRQKIAVSAVFATGFITCAGSAIRLYYTYNKALQDDFTYWIYVQALCACVESAAFMLCCCLPVFPRFWKWVAQRIATMRAYNSQYGSAGPDVDVKLCRLRAGDAGKSEESEESKGGLYSVGQWSEVTGEIGETGETGETRGDSEESIVEVM
ncbi:hypothetical protein NX059_011145 [Plenodomus lindquistii]|nr:hypothetical protein NX059_011145 [Plenodomus lindquistii]